MTIHQAVYGIILCLFCVANKTSCAGKLLKSLRTSSKSAPLIPSVIKQLPEVSVILKVPTDSATLSVQDKPAVPSSYILTVCEAGSEKALKTEISKNHPSLRLAFSRPGFVTFKVPQSDSDARQFAASLGSAMLIDDVLAKAKALLASDSDSSKRLRLHVWGRSEVMPAAGHPLAVGAAKVRVNQIRELLLGCDEAESLWLPCTEIDSSLETDDDSRDLAKEGEHVFDVIVPTGPFITEPLHIGHHIHFAAPRTNPLLIGHSAWPGGNPKVLLPSEAPSRAYLKIEEGLR
jgi:23S rRNA (cytidine2498-2'-O)-methyltransferase